MTAAPQQENMTPIYGHAASIYLQYGWKGPLLLPVRKKADPKPGYSGYKGEDPDYATIMQWATESPYGNIGLRMPENVIGWDEDSYNGRLGSQTRANLEAQLGPLPATWVSTSREDGTGSGIKFFRVPPGVHFVSDLGEQSGVEIVRRHHRYAVVWPSIHPDTGGTYRWYAPGWVPSLVPPSPTQLAELPATWVQYLIKKKMPDARPPAINGQVVSGDSFFNEERRFTYQQALNFCMTSITTLTNAKEGGRNNALNAAAKIVSHFVPEFWSWGAAQDWLYRALDPSYPREEAEATIASAFKSAANDWKAILIPDAPVAGNGANNEQAVLQHSHIRRVELTAASSIKPKRALWLWAGRIPLGELSLLAGREGIGKSTVCYQIASDVTRGKLPGEFQGQGRPVIVIATEDSWEHTIVPRLMAAGADLTQVYRAEVITSDNIVTGLSLPADTEKLKEQINQTGTAMVLLDPLISRLDTKLDTHKDADVRVALEPLVQLAHDCSVAVLGLIHVNKSGTTDPLNSVMGSKAFAAVARSVLYCLVDPEDETEQRRLLGMPKNNLGRTDLPTLAFEITNTYVCESENGSIYTGRIEWTGEVQRGLRDLIETGQGDSESRTAVSEAAAWLSDFLSGQEGGTLQGCRSIDAKKEGAKAGHSKAAISRAAKRLPIVIKSEGFPRQTVWRLMTNEEQGLTDSSDLSNPAMADKSTPPVVSETPWRL